MLDFHAHVLPGADHGSDGMATSLRQLALAEAAGIDTLVATPHFYPQKDDVQRFLRKRRETREALLAEYQGPIRLLTGAEVHLCVGLDHLEALEDLCVSGTRVLLCELPFRGYASGLTETLQRLMEERDLTPVLAHVDRYDPRLIETLFDLGLLGQLNAEGLCRPLRRRRYLPWIDRGHIVALGSDIHGVDEGYTRYLRAADFLGPRLETIETRVRALLAEHPLDP